MYSGYGRLEQYIDNVRAQLDEKLPKLLTVEADNLTQPEKRALVNLKNLKSTITIKPADKNLGVVVLDTTDCVAQCIEILSDDSTYIRAVNYPFETIHKAIKEVLCRFLSSLNTYDKRLYKFLLPDNTHHQVPRFYGVPKIHKKFDHIPPLRPIIANCNSPLTPVAKFLDHVLQPLAQVYPDYLHNSATLSSTLEELHVPTDTILVALDVESLYPSIP